VINQAYVAKETSPGHRAAVGRDRGACSSVKGASTYGHTVILSKNQQCHSSQQPTPAVRQADGARASASSPSGISSEFLARLDPRGANSVTQVSQSPDTTRLGRDFLLAVRPRRREW